MPKILILDDDERVARVAAKALKVRGYEVVTTTSPIGFSKLLREEKPDLVLVDVKMPALSGDSVVQIVKSQPDVHRCPFILWSSIYPDELKELVKTSGADGYVHKPDGPDDLENNVRQYLRRADEGKVEQLVPEKTERRAHPRYACRIPVQITADNRGLSGLALNMSLGGMLLEIPEPFSFGTKLGLCFRLSALDSYTEVDATVRWNKDDAVGLQFAGLQAKDVWAMNRMFKELGSY